MKRRGFIGAALASCIGLALPRKAQAVDDGYEVTCSVIRSDGTAERIPRHEAMRVVGVNGDTVQVERGCRYAFSWDEHLLDGRVRHCSIVSEGPCTLYMDSPAVVRSPAYHPEPPRPPHGTGELPYGIGPWNNWGGFGSEAAFEREAATMVGGG